MKKTQWIDLWTTIKRNKVPYIAIVIFVALGIALYAGMSWSCTYIDKALDETCAATRLAHIRVVYPYGISDEQINKLLAIDGVDDVEGYNFIYRFFDRNGERCQAAVYQLTDRVGPPTVVEGVLPVVENEIAVLSSWAKDNNVKIGDTITFLDEHSSDYRQVQPVLAIAAWDPDSGKQPDISTSDPGYLKTNTFTVTALVKSPEYFLGMRSGYGSNSMNGVQVDAVMFVSKDAMDPKVFNGYTAAAIYSNTLAAMSDGSDAYNTAYDVLQAAVKTVTDTWTDIPDSYTDVLRKFREKLQSAAKQITDGAAEIASKQAELDKGYEALTDGWAQLHAKEQEYVDGKAEYESKLAEAEKASSKLKSAWNLYNCVNADVKAAEQLKSDIANFLAVLTEDIDLSDPDDPAVESDPTVDEGQLPDVEDQPSGGDTQPTGGEDQPSGEDEQHSGEDEQPSGEDEQPSGEDEQPSGEDEQSSGEEGQPSGDEDQPSGDEDQSSGDEDQSSADEEKPSEDQSSGEEDQSSGGGDQSSADEEKPSGDQSSGSEEKPAANEAQPAEAAAVQTALKARPPRDEEQSTDVVAASEGDAEPSDNSGSSEAQPSGGEAGSSESGTQPSGEESSSEAQPSGGNEVPSEGVSEPSASDEQSTGSEEGTSEGETDPSTSGEQPAGSEEGTSEGEIVPSDAEGPSQEERIQTAFEAVKTSSTKLYDLLISQSGKLGKITRMLGKEVNFDGLTSTFKAMADAETPAALKAAIDAAGDWFDSTFADIDAKLEKVKKQLRANQKKLNAAYAQLKDAADRLAEGLRQLNKGREQLTSSAAQLSDAEKALEEARAQLAAKQPEYDDAQKLYDQMDSASAGINDVMPMIFTRSSNVALASAAGIRKVIENARTTLAFMFLIVAVLVGYTTLSRMVADTTVQVGTKKALGFNRWEILRVYLLYVFTAVLIGALLGTGGAFGVETMFNATFASMFEVVMLPAMLTPLPVLIPFAAELSMLTAVALLATLRQLSRKAIDLLTGSNKNAAPKKHHSRSRLFPNMPLLDRIVLANLRQDKRRVIAMLVGIGGSAMLVAAGLTCLGNMSSSIDLQFKNYYQFDTIVRYDTSDENASNEVRSLLDRYGAKYAEVAYTHVLVTDNKGQSRIADVFCPADLEKFSQIVRFSNENGRSTDYNGGLWVSDSLYGKQGMKVGDSMTLQSLTGVTRDFAVSGFYREYLPSLNFVVDAKTWETAYSDSAPNAYLVSTDNIDSEGLLKELSGLDGYICAIAYRQNLQSAFKSILAVIFAISAIFTVMAVLLLFMLLINLLDMDIAEKKRELIILKINGYSTRKVKQYIWKDTLLLCVLGIIVGVVLGTVTGNLTQGALEGSAMQMYHGTSWPACLIAAVITGILALIITLIELKKVDRFRLSDINN